MVQKINYRYLATGEEYQAYELMVECFDSFIGDDYTVEGIKNFYEYIDASKLKRRIEEGSVMIAALDDFKLVGIVEIKDNKHVSLLFVNKDYHDFGIGRKLIDEALDIGNVNELKSISLNSSPNAMEIYKGIGFKAADKKQTKDGVVYIPMELELPK